MAANGAEMTRIPFPPSQDSPIPLRGFLEVPAGSSILFIGRNGAGKTRLAGWLDRNTSSKGIYIPARRDLAMPNSYQVRDQDKDFEMIYGNTNWGSKQTDVDQLKSHRFGQEETAFQSNDFQNVLNVLASRHVSEVQKFHHDFNPASPPPKKGETVLQKAIAIWNECIPDLVINTDKAPNFVVERDGVNYEPISMSDGERGLFYLVAKALLAEPGALIVVDEPEIHLHRAIRNRFWDLMEAARSDCVFAYFTHDIDFASSRSFAERIAVYSFSLRKGQKGIEGEWKYSVVASDQNLPDDLLLSVLGSRKSVLLVEGARGSLDPVIARAVYPAFLVEPVSSCGDVIRGTTSLNKVPNFHHKTVYGLIDRDFRTDEQVAGLALRDVYCHRVREIENVLSTKAVISAILTNFGRESDIPHAISEITTAVGNVLQGQRLRYARELARSGVKSAFDRKINLPENANRDLASIISNIDLKEIDSSSLASVDQALASGDLDTMLSLVSIRKDNLKKKLADSLGVKDWKTLQSSLDSWLRTKDTDQGARLLTALKSQFPTVRDEPAKERSSQTEAQSSRTIHERPTDPALSK